MNDTDITIPGAPAADGGADGYDGNADASHSERADKLIRCIDCGEDFVWTSGEQNFFYDKGLTNDPKRCKPCKQAKNERLAAITAAREAGVRQRVEVSVRCAACDRQTTVPFYPSQGRPVYCRTCFLGRHETGGRAAGSNAERRSAR